ncbi:uncharacterized protein LOC134834082 [Culicoides brevitarsis]|uniref:uncharacterized protein LOC134834082 n=1 Tax=Culicoides brevitarsis TaxID=469753 RepID=UPI00307B508B
MENSEKLRDCRVILSSQEYEDAMDKYAKQSSPKRYNRIKNASDTESENESKVKDSKPAPKTLKRKKTDPFQIDESDKQFIETIRESANDRSIEVFPEMSPFATRDEDDDALAIETDDDFGEEFKDETPKKEVVNKENVQRQSILDDDEDEKSSNDGRNRFSKLSERERETKDSHGKVVSSTNSERVRFVPYTKQRQRSFTPPSVSPWAMFMSQPAPSSPWTRMPMNVPPPSYPWLHPSTPDTNNDKSPYPSNSSKTSASHTLLSEFSKICRNFMFGTCTGNIQCNRNHTFPDIKWVKHMLYQMSIDEVLTFVISCYNSIHCSRIYFPAISSYFGDRKLQRQLLDAISMAESNYQLLQNYKWIVDGLIRAGDSPYTAIVKLLDNRQNHTAAANRVVVEIIVKTKTEINFLEKLVEFAQNSIEIFDVNLFHNFMQVAMTDPAQIETWKVLIEDILENITLENAFNLLDQRLISSFISYLGKLEGAST